MTTDISTPIKVETPKPITTLESALIALAENGKQSVHLSVRQAEVILGYIKRLKQHRDTSDVTAANLAVTISDLADRLASFEVDAFEDGMDD